jgi:hypothetical protein
MSQSLSHRLIEYNTLLFVLIYPIEEEEKEELRAEGQ